MAKVIIVYCSCIFEGDFCPCEFIVAVESWIRSTLEKNPNSSHLLWASVSAKGWCLTIPKCRGRIKNDYLKDTFLNSTKTISSLNYYFVEISSEYWKK